MLLQGCVYLGTSPKETAGISWSIPAGDKYCRVFNFNDTWATLPSGSRIYVTERLEFRRRDGAPPTELLVGVKEHMGNLYADGKFGFNISDPSRVWPIQEADREQATVTPLSQDRCNYEALAKPTSPAQNLAGMGAPTWTCDGKEYPKSGKWFGPAIRPASRAFLALGSWNGEYHGNPSSAFTGPPELDAFIDVFASATGQKLTTLRGHIDGDVGLPLFDTPAWLDSRYLVIPAHKRLRACVICDFQQ